MRAVVTGCAGFIGSHVCERLVADGWTVRGVDAFTAYYDPAEKEANLDGLIDEAGFSLVRGDLATMPLRPLLGDADVVVHLAAQPGVRASFGAGFARCDRDNVFATQRLLEAALATRCRRVVMASSSSVYGDAPVYPCPETAPLSPRSPYAVSKRAGEDLGDVYRHLGLDVVALRYFTVYGPRQRPDMAVRRLCEALTGGPAFELYGAGHHVRDFTHVDDAVDATVRAASAVAPPPVLNVGGGEQASMGDVIDLLGDLAGRPVPVRAGATQRGDVLRTGADTTLARGLGWSPQVGLAAGLATELDWVRARAGRTAPRDTVTAGRAS
ncbi:MAG: NAD-dependent epimerase/dehydratase family protein [Ilumatobacteraceae bacterium]